MQAPTVVTGAASGITLSGATLNGTVNPNGTATSGFFEYGLTAAYGSTTPVQALGGPPSSRSSKRHALMPWSPRLADQIRQAGSTNCQSHSVAALGYLRSSANGRTTRPAPAARSSWCTPLRLLKVRRKPSLHGARQHRQTVFVY